MRKLSALLLVVLSGFSTLAYSLSTFPEVRPYMRPYIGADVTLRHMGFKPGFGKGLFEPTVPQGNAYVGVQLTDYLALEGGYEAIRKRTKTAILRPGDFSLGSGQIALGDPTEGHTFKEEFKGWHIDLIGIVPCLLPCDPSLQFFGGAGVSRKKIRLVDTQVSENGVPLPQATIDTLRRTLVKRKSFLRLSAGVQSLITDYIGIRAIVNWENTARFGYLKSQENPSGSTSANLKNTFSAGLGVFVKF